MPLVLEDDYPLGRTEQAVPINKLAAFIVLIISLAYIMNINRNDAQQ